MNGHWKSQLGVVLVFVLGCLAGGLVSSVFFLHRSAVFLQRGAPAYVEVLERRSTRGLKLDADQKEQVHEAFMANLAQRKQLQAQIQPQVQELNQETLHRIRTILRPDQVEAFRHNLAEMHRRINRPFLNARALDADLNGATNAAPAPVTNSP